MALVQLTFNGFSGGANWFTFHWFTNDGVVADLQQLAEGERDLLNSTVGPTFTTSWAMARMTALYWPNFNVNPLPAIPLDVVDMSGGDPTDPQAARQTMLVEFKTNLAKPAPQKKRCFVGRYGEGNSASGIPSTVITTALTTWAAAHLLPTTVNGHIFTPCVLRKNVLGQVTDAPGLVNYLINQKWAFVRSRDTGRGI